MNRNLLIFTLAALFVAGNMQAQELQPKTYSFTANFVPAAGSDGAIFNASYTVKIYEFFGTCQLHVVSARVNSFQQLVYKGKRYFAVGGADIINGTVSVNIGEFFRISDIHLATARINLCGSSQNCRMIRLKGLGDEMNVEAKELGIKSIWEAWNGIQVIAAPEGISEQGVTSAGMAIEKRLKGREDLYNKQKQYDDLTGEANTLFNQGRYDEAKSKVAEAQRLLSDGGKHNALSQQIDNAIEQKAEEEAKQKAEEEADKQQSSQNSNTSQTGPSDNRSGSINRSPDSSSSSGSAKKYPAKDPYTQEVLYFNTEQQANDYVKQRQNSVQAAVDKRFGIDPQSRAKAAAAATQRQK